MSLADGSTPRDPGTGKGDIPKYIRGLANLSRGSDLGRSCLVAIRRRVWFMGGMARRLRLQYPGAIYHLMARGSGCQEIVRDDVDRGRLQEGLGKAANCCSWRVYAERRLSVNGVRSVNGVMNGVRSVNGVRFVFRLIVNGVRSVFRLIERVRRVGGRLRTSCVLTSVPGASGQRRERNPRSRLLLASARPIDATTQLTRF